MGYLCVMGWSKLPSMYTLDAYDPIFAMLQLLKSKEISTTRKKAPTNI